MMTWYLSCILRYMCYITRSNNPSVLVLLSSINDSPRMWNSSLCCGCVRSISQKVTVDFKIRGLGVSAGSLTFDPAHKNSQQLA